MNHIARIATLLSLSGALAFAQQQTPPPAQAPAPPAQGQPGPMPHGHMGGGPAMRGGKDQRGGGMEARGPEGMHGGMHGEGRIVPPGMWWKNTELATRIGLTADQTKKMDDIFQASRLQLIDLKANVERQEVTLEPMLDANPLESKKVLAQIGKVADARAELEKANAGMLLGIRAVLTPDQWTKLHDHSARRPGGPGAAPGPNADGHRFNGPAGGPHPAMDIQPDSAR